MNYYEARQIQNSDGEPSGLWHFTCRNDGGIWAVGYCADGCPGHPTPKEADAHYHEYRLDRTLRLDGYDQESQHRCQICGEWTQKYATLGSSDLPDLLSLCDEHLTRDSVASLTSPSSRFVSSV